MEVRYLGSYRPPAGKDHGFAPVRLATGRSFNRDLMLQVEVYYRRLLIAAPLAFVTVYLLATGGLYGWLAQKPHNQIAWRDLALPWQWSGLTAKRGDAAVLAGIDDLQARRYADAFYNLRIGLARSPGNVTGRLTLAQLWSAQEPAEAVRVMEEGLALSAGDDRFVVALLDLYARQQIQAHALVMLETLRGQAALTPPSRLLVERTRFALLLQLGQRAEAEAVLPVIRALQPTAATECELALRVQQRQWPVARQLFETHFADASLPPSLLPVVVELAVGAGEAEWLQRVVRRLKAGAPDAMGPYLLAVQAWHRMNRPSQRDAAEQDYYEAFAGNEAALQALGSLAVQLHLPDMIGRARQVAREHGFSGFAYEVQRTELALRRQQWAAARQTLADWEKVIETLPKAQRVQPDLIKRLALAAATGTAEDCAPLVAYLAANRLAFGLPAYLLTAEVLERASLPAVATQVLQIAQPLYPQSDPLVERLRSLQVRLEEMAAVRPATVPVVAVVPVGQAAEVAAAVRAELAARGPAPQDDLVATVATAAAAWKALDAAQGRADWAEVERVLRFLREKPPAWAADALVELKSREVLLRLAMDQRLLALAALKELVNKGGVARGAAFKLAREQLARGDVATAQVLAREIGRLLPDEAAAARLLRESEAAVLPP